MTARELDALAARVHEVRRSAEHSFQQTGRKPSLHTQELAFAVEALLRHQAAVAAAAEATPPVRPWWRVGLVARLRGGAG